MNKQTEIQDATERAKGGEEGSNIVGCFRVFGVESSTICTFLPEPMIGHIPFVSSSPSSTAGPSLFRDKLVCQNQQEREWLASARVISPWNSTRSKLKQQDGSVVARIAEARNVPVEVISVRDWTLFFNTAGVQRMTDGYRAASFVSSTWIEFCFLDFSRWSRICKTKRYAKRLVYIWISFMSVSYPILAFIVIMIYIIIDVSILIKISSR